MPPFLAEQHSSKIKGTTILNVGFKYTLHKIASYTT